MRTTHTTRALAAAAVLTGSALGLAGPAGAAPQGTYIRALGPVVIDRDDPTVATIRARYFCTGEGSLWASVKQVADRSADPALAAEGSSAISEAWSDSHRNPVVCDGRPRTGRFTVDQLEPYFTENGPSEGPKSEVYGPLARGQGWLQLCLFDDTTGEVPASDMVFARVR